MSYKLVIFDLDDTLIHEGFSDNILCDDTEYVLKRLKELKIPIVLATHNHEAHRILAQIHIRNSKSNMFFDTIFAYHDYTNKKSHLTKIIEQYSSISPSEMLFFDDLGKNIITATKLGITGHLVNYTTGITRKDLELYFPEYTYYNLLYYHHKQMSHSHILSKTFI